jgi:hypothetical protein
MLGKRSINLQVGATLRGVIADRARNSGLRNPIPEIFWGRWTDEEDEAYFLGFHDRSRLPVDDPVFIIDANGLEFLLIQTDLYARLEGKTIDIVDNVITVY